MRSINQAYQALFASLSKNDRWTASESFPRKSPERFQPEIRLKQV